MESMEGKQEHDNNSTQKYRRRECVCVSSERKAREERKAITITENRPLFEPNSTETEIVSTLAEHPQDSVASHEVVGDYPSAQHLGQNYA